MYVQGCKGITAQRRGYIDRVYLKNYVDAVARSIGHPVERKEVKTCPRSFKDSSFAIERVALIVILNIEGDWSVQRAVRRRFPELECCANVGTNDLMDQITVQS